MRLSIVAFQGEQGAFSEQAIRAFYGRMVRTYPVQTFREVFQAVRGHRAKFGIIPIENSLFGSVHENYDLLRSFNLLIVGEIKLRVVHSLLVNRGVTLRDVRTIYSHPQEIGRASCRERV